MLFIRMDVAMDVDRIHGDEMGRPCYEWMDVS